VTFTSRIIMHDDLVIDVDRVTKRFAGHTAVQELSLRVPRGSVYGLLGPNGAGKTTTIRMVMNITMPDEGSIRLLGSNAGGRDLSHRIGYMPEERGLYRKMKVLELLVFLAETKGVARRRARSDAEEWLERLDLGDWSLKRVDDLSKGMQQKVQFIATVLHGPELLILDEPFAGFDPVNTQLMKDEVVDLARKGTTVLFSTHIMEQAERMCDSVCIIARGSKVVDGQLAEVKRQHGGRHVVVAVEEGADALARLMADRRLVSKADDYGRYAEVELAEGADAQELLGVLVREGARVTRFEVAEPTLHKIFIDMVGPEAAAPGEAQDA
jgi:ABC-2 type transport system ATP-binding protein